MQEQLSRRNIGRITGYVTEVAYTEVGEGREQGTAALQRRKQTKKQVNNGGLFIASCLKHAQTHETIDDRR